MSGSEMREGEAEGSDPLSAETGGERGIRTLEALLAPTRFPVVLLRPARTSLRRPSPTARAAARDQFSGADTGSQGRARRRHGEVGRAMMPGRAKIERCGAAGPS